MVLRDQLYLLYYSMKFYRNLGPITFQADIGSFQIFHAHPTTLLFQSKSNTNDHLLKDYATFYQHYLKASYVNYYEEQHKTYSILITSCKRIEKYKFNASVFCGLAMEIANTVCKISNMVERKITGDLTKQQIVLVNGKPVYIYLPTRSEESACSQGQICSAVIGLIKSLKNDEDTSQKLLIKKLQKCKSLSQLIEEIIYFENIYSVKNINTCIKNNANTVSKKNPFKKKTSTYKIALFPKERENRYLREAQLSLGSKRPFFSQHRKPNQTLHINLSKTFTAKKGLSSHLSSSLKSPSRLRSQKLKTSSSESCHKHLLKTKDSSKMIKLTEEQPCAVSSTDQNKLLKKLHSKKLIKKEEQKMKSDKNISRSKQTLVDDRQQLQKSDLKVQRNKRIIEQQCQAVTYPEQLAESITMANSLLQERKHESKIVQNIKYESISKNASIHISQNHSNPIKLPQKAIKKMIPIYEQISDEIQTIQLGSNKQNKKIAQQQKNNQMMQTKYFKKRQSNQNAYQEEGRSTKKNSWRQSHLTKDNYSELDTVRLNISYQKNFIEERKNLDYMGSAVVNTMIHLKNYSMILWELPMFYLYKKFYRLRVQMSTKYQKIAQKPMYAQFMYQNQKVKGSINKLIKIVVKKLKKDQADVYKSIKNTLDLQESGQFQELYKDFVIQYLQSLREASSQFQELLMHEIQVVDAYLVGRGEKIDERVREKIEEKAKAFKIIYLKAQKSKINSGT